MSRNAYWEHLLHITWHTKNNEPLLVGPIEKLVHEFLRCRALESPGTIVHEVGGIEDRVHLAVSLPPTVAPAAWIGQMKGSSSHFVNHRPNAIGYFDWQVGYGLVGFGKSDLKWVVEYVRNQREHHYRRTTLDRLERIDPE